MKRGFLNTTRYRKEIDEVHAPASPHRLEQSRQGRPIASPTRVSGVENKPGADGDAMEVGVEETITEDVYADGHIVAVRVIRSAKEEKPSEVGSCADEHGGMEAGAKSSKAKGKQKAVDVDDNATPKDGAGCHNAHLNLSFHPPRPLPGRPGWGRTPEEDFFHTVPESHGGRYKKRAIFRAWPRSPQGLPILPREKDRGTLSPDGYPWGATLYDFYQVNRLPHVGGIVSLMTGSALCQAMHELGELDVAAPEIEWAKSEGKPRLEGVADTEELIKCADMRMSLLGRCGGLFQKAGGDKPRGKGEKPEINNSASNYVPPPPMMPITSPFHPSNYPEPWPLTPFENHHSILLQERIPLHLLPKTLYVHDPFDLLTVREQEFHDTSWTSRPDVIRTYELQFSEPVCSQVREARVRAEELEEFKARTLIIMRYQRTKEQIKNHEPIIEVPLPPYPRRPTTIEEGHLYLSPASAVGEGHHSVVYNGEWELPREIFMKKTICRLCFKESADKEIQRLKNTGRWERMLKAVSWGPNGHTGRKPTRAELDAVCDPINLKRDGEIIEREITCIVSHDSAPSQIVEMINATGTWNDFMENRQANKAMLQFVQDIGEDSPAPTIRIDPPFSYESQISCTHGRDPFRAPVPLTAKFTVVAKLSIKGDPHLAREATNYQEFPERFFNHYNGYTIIKQIHCTVPVNAVVPQFYGYYVASDGGNSKQPYYLSPILLLEHCGEPIDPEELSGEEQEECASLILRFQRAGWLHESLAPRNFLVQMGKPTEFPLTRQCKPELSFRLIDFGRSRRYNTAAEKRSEEMEALRMFRKLSGQMGVTL